MEYIQLTAIVEPLQPGTDILISELAELGFESFEETSAGLKAWIQKPLFNSKDILQIYLFKDPQIKITYEVQEIADQNWNEEWEKNFSPIEINETAVIKASFHNLEKKYDFEFIISPKMAFGTGHHETTWMMANALFTLDMEGKCVLDMGCGTGILAVIAEKRGAAKIVAVDIEEPAVENTLEHLQLNDCKNCEVLLGGVEVLGKETFDIILANINRNVLTRDMDKYVQVLKVGGLILFSGFFSTDIELLSDSATKSGLSCVSIANKNNWAQLTFKKTL